MASFSSLFVISVQNIPWRSIKGWFPSLGMALAFAMTDGGIAPSLRELNGTETTRTMF
jgi:hypothetical protein